MKKSILIILFSILYFAGMTQNLDIQPTIEPQFFAADEEITITYDVTGTYMQDWDEAWLWLWIPNSSVGVASNINPANSNSSATDVAKFTKEEVSGKFLFSIKLTLTDFTNGTVDQIASVGTLIKGNDWSDGQTVDHVTEISDDFRIIMESPNGNFAFYETAEDISIIVKSSQSATIKILLDGDIIAQADNVTELSQTHTIITDGSVHEIKTIANTATESDSLIYSYSIKPSTVTATLPAGLKNGINYHADSTSATLVLLAPNKENVFVIGDFNDWLINDDYLMQIDGEQYWIKLENLEKGKEYKFQYLVDGEIRIADPYSEKISSPFDDGEIIQDNRYPGLHTYPSNSTSEALSYLQTSKPQFVWEATDYQRPEKKDLVIYELLVRDFDDRRTYNAVLDRLDYLDSLGINAIELMPIMEFEGNLSWGYNPSFMLATDKYYGTERELKILIDEAHKRGMAVIFDIVLNHAFGRNTLARLDNDGVYGAPNNTNPWLNRSAKHDFNVGYDFNHESQYTKDYVDRVTEYWINEYNIDGYRFDLSKGFTQNNTLGNTGAWGNYDASRIKLLKRMADHIWSIDSESYVILEHFADNEEEKELANYGMMLWGNMNGAYISAAKGNSTNLGWLYYDERGWDKPHAIGYMESHDEERVMWELIGVKKYELAKAMKRGKQNAAFFFLVPGPKMIWQFEELGYDLELNNDRLGIKPTKWDYFEDEERKKLFDVYSSLIKLKNRTDYLDEQYFEWEGAGFVKWLNYNGPDFKLAAYANFGTIEKTEDVHFPADGTWYEYFSGTEIIVTDFVNFKTPLQPGEFHIYTSEPIDNFLNENPLVVTNIKKEQNLSIEIYPNPSNENITITTNEVIGELKIYDNTGRIVKTYNGSPAKKWHLSLSYLKPGLYFLEGISKNSKFSKKIIRK